MRVLITGVAGFIGSHLAERHLRRGDEVLGLDDFSSSSPESKHLERLRKTQRFKFERCNISYQMCQLPFFYETDPPFDLIYNFACPASPPVYSAKSIYTLDTCFNGTKNVLDLARAHGAKIIHASTSEVYGDPDQSPQREDYWGNVNSFGPRSCYDEGKRVAEALCYEYQHKKDVDVRLVRIFNTYGPHMDKNDGRVITNFITQAMNDDDITIYGDGSQTRSFCYVSDLIDGILELGSCVPCDDVSLPINLGNPTEFTIMELAALVIKLTKSSSSIVHRSLPVDDPMQRRPDISRATRVLDYRPCVELTDGLSRTIQYLTDLG